MRVILAAKTCYPFHQYGGMERFFFNLALHLVRNGCEVEILTSGLKGQTAMKVQRTFRNITYTFIYPRVTDYNVSFTVFPFLCNAMAYLLSQRFDIIHSCGVVNLYVLLKERRPVVLQIFGLEPIRYNWTVKKLHKLMIIYPLWKTLIEHVEVISTETEYLKRLIVHFGKISPDKVFVLPVGIDLAEIEKIISNPIVSKRSLGLHNADLVLINVNRLEPFKGVVYLIEALKILNETLDVRLILVGTGSAEADVHNYIDKLGLKDKVIHFKNIPYNLLYQLFSIADISVTPTLGEGIPTVILEAMACGKPIVASRVPGIVEIVRHGKNGFLVEPANSKAIADAILEMYDKGLLEKMGAKSRELVRAYDWNIIAKKALEIYEKVINKDH